MATKIVIIGGGSFSWGPLFIRDILLTSQLAGATIALHDVDSEALELVYSVGKAAISAGCYSVTLTKSASLDEALEGADFVILTISTGGLESMRHDVEIPAHYGIVQPVGDTVGPGGLARGLRNIPVVVDLARQMETICPDAWLLNYTNPLTTLTRAITRETSIKCIGLCHEYEGVRRKLARVWGVTPEDIEATVAGINHLPWMLDVTVRGEEARHNLQSLATDLLASRGREIGYESATTRSTIDRGKVKSQLLQAYGALPAAGDRHLAEFFPFFLTKASDFGRQFGIEPTSIEERYLWRKQEHAHIQSLLHNEAILFRFLKRPSAEAASRIICALLGNGLYSGALNLPNRGQIPNLPPESVVETMGVVDANGTRARNVTPLPKGIDAVVGRHVANQELIVEAALDGDRKLASMALLNDPLNSLQPGKARQMLDAMLLANRQYLPRFFELSKSQAS